MYDMAPGPLDKGIARVILCTGKVYYDLAQERSDRGLDDKVAILRLEEIAPFPEKALTTELKRFPRTARYVWAQEEPRNMGAWFFTSPRIDNIMEALGVEQRRLVYAGRKPAASPATGNNAQHQREQQQLVDDAFTR